MSLDEMEFNAICDLASVLGAAMDANLTKGTDTGINLQEAWDGLANLLPSFRTQRHPMTDANLKDFVFGVTEARKVRKGY